MPKTTPSGGQENQTSPLKSFYRKHKPKIFLGIFIVVVIIILAFALTSRKEKYLIEQTKSDPQSKEDVNWNVSNEVGRILKRQQQNLSALVRH